jgi:hypothetical protein
LPRATADPRAADLTAAFFDNSRGYRLIGHETCEVLSAAGVLEMVCCPPLFVRCQVIDK